MDKGIRGEKRLLSVEQFYDMNKEILKLAIPNILSNISVPLLSTVDTALMGRLSEVHIGAVGLGAMIFNFIYWNFGFLRMGTTGLTAQEYGKGSVKGIAANFGRSMMVALGLAAFVMAIHVPLAESSFYLLNVDGSQRGLVAEYFYIRIWAAPATLSLYAFMGWFFGMQNAIYPMILTIFINVVNIVLSYYFVHVLGWEVAGVAYGTMIAQYAGFVLAIILFYFGYQEYIQHFRKELIIQWTELKKFLQVNGDIFIRTFCLTFAFGYFYSQSSANGELILAANVILLQFLNWMSYGVDGFAFASESLVGKYAGAKDEAKTNQAIRLTFIWGMGLAAIFALVYGLFGVEILRLFTNQEDVIATTIPFLIWMVLFPLLSTPCYLWDGIFIGLTASKAMRNGMIAAFAIYLGSNYLLLAWENDGLWLALLLFMIARGGIQQWLYWRYGMALK